jgi:hypothetical protein
MKPIDYIGLLGDRPPPAERKKLDHLVAQVRDLMVKNNIQVIIPEATLGRRLLDRHLPRDLWEVLANG